MFEEQPKIRFNRRLNSDTWLMGMRSPRIAKSAKPGQFVMIRVGHGTDPLLRRPFSICGKERDVLLVLYRVVGQGTAILSQAKEGERSTVLGPLGRGFELPPKGSIPILVGGGIGVAPLFFLAQGLKNTKTEFMVGFASARDILEWKEMRNPRTRIRIATDDGSRGHAGFVTDLLKDYLRRNISDKEAFSLYACGPKPMMKKVAQVALVNSIPCQISLEASMACGIGACQGCAVKASDSEARHYLHVCKDGPVFQAETIDWEAL
jgi:dihydroorotate dehydrogenase electron transfer subunit